MKALVPDKILLSLKSGTIAPFYLFYGPEEFWIEIILDEIKRRLIPDSVKDFNLEILYADDVSQVDHCQAHGALFQRGPGAFSLLHG